MGKEKKTCWYCNANLRGNRRKYCSIRCAQLDYKRRVQTNKVSGRMTYSGKNYSWLLTKNEKKLLQKIASFIYQSGNLPICKIYEHIALERKVDIQTIRAEVKYSLMVLLLCDKIRTTCNNGMKIISWKKQEISVGSIRK